MAAGDTQTPGSVEAAASDTARPARAEQPWPLWEVFIQARRGLSHVHAGSVHAPDAELAMQNARDVYTRRGEGDSIWVVPSNAIVASSPGDKGELFEPALDKAYRHPTFYEVPDGVTNM